MIIGGDTHGDFGSLNTLINKTHPDHIIIPGDFGYWPKFDKRKYDRYLRLHGDGNLNEAHFYAANSNEVDSIKPQDTNIWWCDGNHEHHDQLDRIKEEHGNQRKPIEIRPKVFYCPRGTVVEFYGLNFMFMGGGDSIDKSERTIKFDWFPQEIITQKDLYNLPSPDDIRIDVIISHTCPDFLVKTMMERSRSYMKHNDPSTKALEALWEMYRPKLWYFGHWHCRAELFVNGTRFHALSHSRQPNWYTTFKGE